MPYINELRATNIKGCFKWISFICVADKIGWTDIKACSLNIKGKHSWFRTVDRKENDLSNG